VAAVEVLAVEVLVVVSLEVDKAARLELAAGPGAPAARCSYS
jgi:hypothetical protein